jgi:hypothetical protein
VPQVVQRWLRCVRIMYFLRMIFVRCSITTSVITQLLMYARYMSRTNESY